MTRSSVLELAVGGLPFPHGGPDGGWRYRHGVRPDGPSPLDRQAVSDFLAYERAHGRRVTVVADERLSGWDTWQAPSERPSPSSFPTQCCTDAYAGGCGAPLVCHGAPADVAVEILRRGALLAATAVTGRSATELAAQSTWGEPADYFDHVTFANGRCRAPEAVALSRSLGRDLVPADLRRGYPPAVRFYFRWETLAGRSDAVFDGVHAVKILRRLALGDTLAAVVVTAGQRGLVAASLPDRLRDRLAVVDLDRPAPEEWAAAALIAAEGLT
jgi:hypothetical protein